MTLFISRLILTLLICCVAYFALKRVWTKKVDLIGWIKKPSEVIPIKDEDKGELEIFYDGRPVSGKTITINKYNRFIIPLGKFYVKNVGTKPAKDVSIEIHFSEGIRRYTEMLGSTTTHGPWSISRSSLEDYVSILKYDEAVFLNPKQSWNRPYLLVLNMETPAKSTSEISAKLSVYYGVDKPLEVELILKPTKENK